ncbi:MAG: carbon-nitrogen hydrolase family protein [Pseudomonadota bacterium]
MRAGLVQLNSSDDPAANLPITEGLIREAAAGGADLVLTPEVSNIISASRTRQGDVLCTEAADPTLARLSEVAADTKIWLLIGSLALKQAESEAGADARFVNRSFLIDSDGGITARYDKIHMFDVALGGAESYSESSGYRPGEAAMLAETPLARIGMTICYDLRFGHLYRMLAESGAEILTIPSAFTVPTGAAHWEVLLRARAIETGCFVLAPAQFGRHAAARGRVRETYGHSLAIDPWGRILADAGEGVGVTLVDLDMALVADARERIPSLSKSPPFRPPV